MILLPTSTSIQLLDALDNLDSASRPSSIDSIQRSLTAQLWAVET